MKRVTSNYGLKEPEFIDQRGHFTTVFYKAENSTIPKAEADSDIEAKLVDFCKIPRSRAEMT